VYCVGPFVRAGPEFLRPVHCTVTVPAPFAFGRLSGPFDGFAIPFVHCRAAPSA